MNTARSIHPRHTHNTSTRYHHPHHLTSVHHQLRSGSVARWPSRGCHTRSHPELGRETPQRPWYCVSRHGRVGRRRATQPDRTVDHRTDPNTYTHAGWSSPVARQAHNLKVTGSNPVPASLTKTSPHSPSTPERIIRVRGVSMRGVVSRGNSLRGGRGGMLTCLSRLAGRNQAHHQNRKCPSNVRLDQTFWPGLRFDQPGFNRWSTRSPSAGGSCAQLPRQRLRHPDVIWYDRGGHLIRYCSPPSCFRSARSIRYRSCPEIAVWCYGLVR